MKLAAIDIGSNAARLLISEVGKSPDEYPTFTKVNLVRIPLRLGFDVFANGTISEKKADALLKTIQAYQLLLEVYDIKHLKACATSAMRDADNGAKLLKQVKSETGISIEIISGQEEASFIYENHFAEKLNKARTYLYIDVGGGSTEITVFNKEKLAAKESFNIGTIRLLHDQVKEEQWDAMKAFLKQLKSSDPPVCIGTGGNINKVFSLSKKKEGKPLTLNMLKDYYKELGSFALEERMQRYNLRPDRADVIVPALQIYIAAMRWTDAEEIYVPKIGLADGLIHSLYDEVKEEAS